jgi:transcription elongation factor Elf1
MAAIRNPQIFRLLERFLDGRITKIVPEYDLESEEGYSYPEIDAILETSSKETIKILDDLYREGILKRKFYDKLFSCQECGSYKVKPSPQCPMCKSFNISKGQAIEHLDCGHVDLEENFRTDEGRVCPKCGKKVRQIGVDYSRVGALYRCEDCGEKFSEPMNMLRCMRCGATFPQEEAAEKNIYSYTFNEAMKNRILLQIRPKRLIESLLRSEGYEVQSSVPIVGQSGVRHELDIYAVKKTNSSERKVVVGLSGAKDEVPPEEILKLFAKATDIGANETIIVAIPKASKETKFFADHYGIKCIEATELEEARMKFKERTEALSEDADKDSKMAANRYRPRV